MTSKDQILTAVLARAATDRYFRQQLIVDPRTALKSCFGVAIPEEFRIRFVERGSDLDALVVLPDFIGEGHDGEASDAELEMVNGGVGGTAW
jgi:hypothetical protein